MTTPACIELRDPAAERDAFASRLVVAAQFGDLAALDALLREIQVPLFRHLAFVLESEDAARDALQDALLTISRRIGTLREPRLFRAWCFRVATRIALRQARRGRAGPALVALDQATQVPDAEPDARPFDDEQLAALRTMLPQVPPASRLILHMHYEQGLTHREIAEALDISIGTVKSRHHYGLQWLRRQLP